MRALPAPSASLLSGWKRLAIVLLAVPAILVGLLAMHVLTTGPSHAADAHGSIGHASMAADESVSAHTLTAHSHETTDCDSVCGADHDMLGMACILALLMTALIVTVRLTLLRWSSPPPIASTIMARISALAPPQPPSLLVLSISRT